MKKIICYLLLLAVSTSSLFAWGSKEVSDGEKIKIGVSLPTQREEGWVKAKQAFQDYAREHKDTIELMLQVADTNIATQNKQINNMITAEVDVLIIGATDSAGVATVVDRANAEGIEVISYDRLITGTKNVSALVTFDNIKVGELQGEFLVSNMPYGNYILLSGAPTDNNSAIFKKGAMQFIQPLIDSGAITVIADQGVENWDPINAKNIVVNALTAHNNDVQAILAPNDNIAGGAISALEDQGITGVWISGQDSQIDAARRILEGRQGMTVFKDSKKLPVKAIEIAIALVTGSITEIETKTINNGSTDVPLYELPPVAVTKDNLKEVLVDSGYISAEDIGL